VGPVVAPTVAEFVKVPVEVADAVALIVEVVVTLQWQVASAVIATVTEVVTLKNKVADAVSLVVEWDIMTILMTMRYLVMLQDVIVMVNAKAEVSVGPTNKAAVTMRQQVKLAVHVMVQKVVKVMRGGGRGRPDDRGGRDDEVARGAHRGADAQRVGQGQRQGDACRRPVGEGGGVDSFGASDRFCACLDCVYGFKRSACADCTPEASKPPC